MIKANELRIGNWVRDSDGFNKVIHIEESFFYTEMFKNTFADIKPIPLTEEILLKCGFEKLGLIKYELNGVALNIKWSSYFIHRFETEIKYLHQLQNLYFALKGEELEINL